MFITIINLYIYCNTYCKTTYCLSSQKSFIQSFWNLSSRIWYKKKVLDMTPIWVCIYVVRKWRKLIQDYKHLIAICQCKSINFALYTVSYSISWFIVNVGWHVRTKQVITIWHWKYRLYRSIKRKMLTKVHFIKYSYNVIYFFIISFFLTIKVCKAIYCCK